MGAGPAGNLAGRLRWDRGVVDFIDAGVGAWRFYTFNVADIGVVVGAMVLALTMARHDKPASAYGMSLIAGPATLP